MMESSSKVVCPRGELPAAGYHFNPRKINAGLTNREICHQSSQYTGLLDKAVADMYLGYMASGIIDKENKLPVFLQE